MRRKNNRNGKYIILLLVLLIGIGFAYVAANMNILTSLGLGANRWDIYFTNPQLTGNGVSGTTPTVSNKTTVNFSCSLPYMEDYFEFTIDLVNNSTLDATVSNITYNENNRVTYSIVDSKGNSLHTGTKLKKGKTKTYTVKVTYNLDTQNYLTEDTNVNLGFSIDYSAINPKDPIPTPFTVVSRTSSSTITVGDMVTINEENFYVLKIDTTNDIISLIAESYLIYLDPKNTNFSWSNTAPAAVQNDEFLQYKTSHPSVEYMYQAFSKKVYWENTCQSYPCDVYDTTKTEPYPSSNYSAAYVVEQYLGKLRVMGLDEETEGRLLNQSDLTQFNCTIGGTCDVNNLPAFLTISKSYYTSVAASTSVWSGVYCKSYSSSTSSFSTCTIDGSSNWGDIQIRPVLDVPSEYIQALYK